MGDDRGPPMTDALGRIIRRAGTRPEPVGERCDLCAELTENEAYAAARAAGFGVGADGVINDIPASLDVNIDEALWARTATKLAARKDTE